MSSFEPFCLAQDLLDDFMLPAHLTITILQMDFVSLSYFRHQDNEINIFLPTTGIFNAEIPSQTTVFVLQGTLPAANLFCTLQSVRFNKDGILPLRELAALSLVHTNNH